MRVGGAQILVRIDRHIVHADFIVKVRPGGAARLAHVADDLAANHMLAGNTAMRKDARRPSSRRGRDRELLRGRSLRPCAASLTSAVGGRAHRRAVRRVDVDAGVECAFAVDRDLRARQSLRLRGPRSATWKGASASAVQSPVKLASSPPSSARETRPDSACVRRCVKLVDGKLHLLLASRRRSAPGWPAWALPRLRRPQAWLRQLVLPQPVKSRHFIGQRAQRGHLHIAVVRNLRHLLVVFAQVLPLLRAPG
jgi:hypothetical protein